MCEGAESWRRDISECRKPGFGVGASRSAAQHPGHSRHAAGNSVDEDRNVPTFRSYDRHARKQFLRGEQY